MTAARRGLAGLLRAVAWALALLALLVPFAGTADVVAAVLAVPVALLLAEALLWAEVRTGWISGLVLLALVAGPVGAGVLSGTSLATWIGPGLSLALSGMVVASLGVAAVVGGFRALGARAGWVRALEVVVLGGLVATVFAAHRDGAVGRPLALADLAWSLSLDPRTVLLGVAALAAAFLLGLLAVEHEGRLRVGAVVLVPLLLLAGWWVARMAVAPPPEEATGLADLEGDGDEELPREAPDQPPVDVAPEPVEPGEDDGAAADGAAVPPEAEQGDGEPADGEPQDGEPEAPQEGEAPSAPTEGQPADDAPEAGEPPPSEGEGEPATPPPGASTDDGQADAADAPSEPPDGPADDGEPSEGRAGGGGDASETDLGDGGGAAGADTDGDAAGEADSDGVDAPPTAGDDEGTSRAPPRADPVAVLLLDDDWEPPRERWYLRQGALSVYDGHRLVPAPPGSDVDRDVISGLPLAPLTSAAPPPDASRRRLSGTVSVLVEHPAAFGPDFPIAFASTPNPDPTRFVRTWSFVSSVDDRGFSALVGHTSDGPGWSADVRATYLQAPTDPRYRKLADEILAGLGDRARADPLARALAVKRWLDDHMIGDTSRRHDGVDDPTADFLFGDLHGYCVHGAHASVYLDRLLGVPARIGVGYAVPASDRRGSTLIVRSHEAHAWPEVWLDGVGWVDVDPTPREVLDAPPPPLDEDVARQLGELARQVPEEADVPPSTGDMMRELWPLFDGLLQALKWLLASLVGLAVLAVYAAKVWFAVAPWLATSRQVGRVAYRAALHRLVALGFAREAGESPERFARRVADVAPSLAALVAARSSATLGGRAQPSASALRALVRAVSRESATAVPWWRHVLAWLDPTTTFRVR